MRVLVWSDIQFHPWQEFSRILPNGLNSRFQDQLNVQEEIISYAENNGIDMMVHDGDLVESMTEKIDKNMFVTIFDRFAQTKILTIFLVGNHDWLDKTETKHILKPFEKLDNIVVVDKPLVEGGLAFIPYTRNDFIKKVNDVANKVQSWYEAQAVKSCPTYLFIHQGINGAVTGPRDTPLRDEFSLKDLRPEVFDIIFCGHYHKQQRIGNLQIVGSSLQKDMGERNDKKGFFVLDTEQAPRNPVFVETHAPRFYKVDAAGEKLIEWPNGFTDKDFLWIVSDGIPEKTIRGLLDIDSSRIPDHTHIRVEVVKKEIKEIRTEVSLFQPVKVQLGKAIDYLLKVNSSTLDKEKVLEMAMVKYEESLDKI